MKYEEFEQILIEITHDGDCCLCGYGSICECHLQCMRIEELYDDIEVQE